MSKIKHNEKWNLIKNYRWQSIFFKYLRMILIAFSLPISIFVAIILFSSNIKENAEIEIALEKSFGKTLLSVNQSLAEIDKTSSALSSDKNTLSMLTLDLSPKTQSLALEYYKIFDIKSQTLKITKDYISSISIYSISNKYIYGDDGAYLADYIYKDVIDYALSGDAVPKLFYNKAKKCLVRTYPVFNPNSNECVGIIFTYIDILSFNKAISGEMNNDEKVFILNSDKEFIFTGNTRNSLDAIDKSIITSLTLPVNSEYTLKKYNDYYYCYATIPTYNYILVSKIPSNYISGIKTSTFIFILTMLAAVILSILLSYFVSIKIYGTIVELISGIEVPSSQPVSEQKEHFNELLYINNNIVSIMDKNAVIEKELEDRITQLRRAQSVALQTQINPHFIFNTLNLVNVFIMKITKRDTEATRIISLLSDILHDTLNTKNFIITLGEEIEYASKYIEIEKIKSLNSFDVEITIAPETLKCKIIKLSLQPIIENAVEHGFKNLPPNKRGLLSIRSEIKSKTLIITIKDNGEGMSIEKLKTLTQNLVSDTLPETRHIGLCNVNQRIQLIFGSEYGVNIKSSPEETSVIITFPAD